MEASVDPQCRGPDWMPITPKTGSLFHAETQLRRRMIEDMTIRKFAPKTQHDYLQRVV